jgi:hypothetical protein
MNTPPSIEVGEEEASAKLGEALGRLTLGKRKRPLEFDAHSTKHETYLVRFLMHFELFD